MKLSGKIENWLRIFFILLLLKGGIIQVAAQKPALNVEVLNKWPRLGGSMITGNGEYVSYSINAYVNKSRLNILYLQSTKSSWKKEIEGGSFVQFSKNGRYVYYNSPKGLIYLKLGSETCKKLEGLKAGQYKIFELEDSEWLSYIDANGSLNIMRVQSDGKSRKIENVKSYFVNPNGQSIVLCSGGNANDKMISNIEILSLKNFERKKVWSGKLPRNLVFDNSGSQVAFIAEESGKGNAIWKVDVNNLTTVKLLEDYSPKIDTTFKIVSGSKWGFTLDGKNLLFGLEANWVSKPKKGTVMVDVWNYQDNFLQSQQLSAMFPKEIYLCGINLVTSKLNRLTYPYENVINDNFLKDGEDLIVEHIESYQPEFVWNSKSAQTTYLININTGMRKLIKEKARCHLKAFSFSPDKSMLVYFDPLFQTYFSYNQCKEISVNITKGLTVDWAVYIASGNEYYRKKQPIGVLAWLENSSAVLINDSYDIWKVDPLNRKQPVNLTRGEGLKNKIIFNEAIANFKSIEINKPFLLKAFNTQTKECGVYELKLQAGERSSFRKLYMSNHIYSSSDYNYQPLSITSSRDSKAFVIQREGAKDYPNYFFTTDFKNFKQFSNLKPNADYNWLGSELHNVLLPDGGSTQGILYKPENFDPTKKYPVIIYFYEYQTHDLNRFPMPFFGACIDVAHFTSNEYLVFKPDIKYTDHAGISALKTIEASAKYLAEKPWVNGAKMGINGGSFGGYECNYIITHSKMFAAASTACGVANAVSNYNMLWKESGTVNHGMWEHGHYRMNGTPWDMPEKYSEASPMSSIGNVVTPVLIVHNKEDAAVPFSEGVQFYTGLRRAGKKVWMLQYDGEGHINLKRENAIDIETRLMQFFDHYLKGKPAPKWMTRGIPAKMKGIDDGLELDTEIKTPGPGLTIKTN